MKNNSAGRQILGGIASLLASVIFLITFVDSKYVPTWRDIFGIYETYDKQADIISFIDVGQGDCILIQSDGRFALIDTGEADEDLPRILKHKGINGFDAVILSHWHSDHCQGFYDIAESFEIDNVIVSGYSQTDDDAAECSREIRGICEKEGIDLHNAIEGMVIYIGEIELTVLFCDSTASQENNRSIIVMAKYKDKKILLTGDAEAQLEEKIVESGIDIECDVLKVAHHGSDTSSTEEFLKLCSPEYAVISVGNNNSYGHPTREVLNRLYSIGAQIYRTDYDGNVDFELSEEGIAVTTQY